MIFFKQAERGINAWYFYAAGIALVIVGYILGQMPLIAVQSHYVDTYNIGLDKVNEYLKTNDFSLLHISRNLGFFLMILMFVGAMAMLYIATRIHKKQFLDIVTSRSKFDVKRFLFAFLWWTALSLVVEFFIYLANPGNYKTEFNLSAFIVLALICIIFLPIQTALEEFFFRGYLLQGIYLISKSPVMAIVLSTVLFSMVHTMNPEVEKFGFWPMQMYYLGAGIFFAILAYADGGLELSLGLHTSVNLFGAMILKYEGSVIQTDAIFCQLKADVWLNTFMFYATAIVFYYLAQKKYGWTFTLKELMKASVDSTKSV